ncbi:hypothetical protein BCR42DRAFT_448241 [Absidia repens]|uniref:Protein Zds1 C-terminal domain-containing protein n=1 Tax=Absidia repens TaxID=90262 RepID=A0A1X2IS70_9FUNG|nr:hypothetical protein BCR42DRAFT_448241 [Absidia repens]
MCDHNGAPFATTGLALTPETNQRLSLTEAINVSTPDSSHLFWVPASHHPEIAPTEFEKHVQALRTNIIDDDKVRRRRSALSVSFTAVDNGIQDDVDIYQLSSDKSDHGVDNYQTDRCTDDNDKHPAKDIDQQEDQLQHIFDDEYQQKQTCSSIMQSNPLHSLTKNDADLQQTMGTASATINEPNEIDGEDNPNFDQHSKLETKARKGRMRRSMSLQQLPSKSTDPGNIPDFHVFDRNSTILDQSPILISKTNRPLSRRGARTKFRKTSTVSPSSLKSTDVPIPEKEWPVDGHTRPSSAITDTNSMDNFDSNIDNAGTALESQQCQYLDLQLNEEPEMDVGVTSTFATVTPIQHPTSSDQQQFNVSTKAYTKVVDPIEPSSPMPISATSSTVADTNHYLPPSESPIILQQSKVESPPRERKSSWSWSFWTDEKKAKSDKSQSSTAQPTPLQSRQVDSDIEDKESENASPITTTPSTSTGKQRFGLSSLFSRKSSTTSSSTSSTSDAKANSENEKIDNSTSVQMPPKNFQLNKMTHQRRLPIHTERAIYRLSHMKLANSRRPLRDQVIISNFMFWYLTIINAQQQQQTQLLSTPSQHDNSNSSTSTSTQQNMPRTPQQIITASRKKKRPIKKNHQQNNSSEKHQQQKHGDTPTTTNPTSYQQKRSSSLSTSSPQPREKTMHHYIDKSSKQSSTGFVVPENYLRPATHSSGNNTKQQRQHPGCARSNSWSSEDEDEDEDESESESDDSDDDDNEIIGYAGKGRNGRNSAYTTKSNGQSARRGVPPRNVSHENQQKGMPTSNQHLQQQNHHHYNQRQLHHQKKPNQQHPQQYLISASAT